MKARRAGAGDIAPRGQGKAEKRMLVAEGVAREPAWKSKARVVVVTGLSGSGKSTAIKAFEDLGFFCVDNLPVLLLPEFLKLRQESSEDLYHIAIGMDIREPRFLQSYKQIFLELGRSGIEFDILFLEAADEVLQRRYSQTRRRHPLAGHGSLLDGIEAERLQLAELKRIATRVLDTSQTSVHDLKRIIGRLYGFLPREERLHIHLLSFGFKYGIPVEGDIVMDVRFLPNPFFVDDLRDLTGRDGAVVDFVLAQKDTEVFLERFKSLLEYLLPRYAEEGKSYLTIALGCTGGRHRSVVLTDHLADYLEGLGYSVTREHRDMGLDGV